MLQIPQHLTPRDLRALASAYPDRYPVLFDSVSQGALARWTVLSIACGAALWIDSARQLHSRDVPTPAAAGFLDSFDAWWRHEQTSSAAVEAGPWRSGWAVFLGYELAAEIEPSLHFPTGPEGCLGFALRTPAALVFDHREDRCWALAEPGHQRLLADLQAHVPKANARFQSVSQLDTRISDGDPESLLHPGSLQESSRAEFIAGVQRAQAYIAAGDIYQVNLARRWNARLALHVSAAHIYERLRIANPAPFGCRAQFAGLDIHSSSPERLLHIANGEINTRPIAGTRPRHASSDRDAAQKGELLANPKERAEHVMLIDLERNDLGRVCMPGSIEVSEFMSVESFAHVHHIVSNVRGRLRNDVTPIGALRAIFPGGTITGCPKIRCMKIIAELEVQGRGVYTGSLGWIGRDGSADFNILIRTLCVQDRELSFRAGCGIVADSIPELELQETRAKARGLLQALGEAA